MNDPTEKKTKAVSCGCGGNSCCTRQKGWIWLALAIAVGGVLIAKNVGKKPKADSPAARETPATVEAGRVAVTASEPVAQGQALPRLVDLGAGKCPSCKMMTPILADLQKTYAGIMDVTFIDVWENTDAAEKYGIKMIPTQIFYDASGKELFRHEGFFGKADILAKWKELGVELTP